MCVNIDELQSRYDNVVWLLWTETTVLAPSPLEQSAVCVMWLGTAVIVAIMSVLQPEWQLSTVRKGGREGGTRTKGRHEEEGEAGERRGGRKAG